MLQDKQIADSFIDLLNVLRKLRAPGGCEWDQKQTSKSLVPYLLEETYEIIDPEGGGVDSAAIDLTARSGRAALSHRLSLLGITLNKIELETLYTKFLEMADKKKLIHDEDLYELVKKKK